MGAIPSVGVRRITGAIFSAKENHRLSARGEKKVKLGIQRLMYSWRLLTRLLVSDVGRSISKGLILSLMGLHAGDS